MSVSRRRFMKSGAMAAMAAGLLLESSRTVWAQEKVQSGALIDYFQIPLEAQQNPLFSYKRSTFEPYLGGIFTARDARSRIIELTLLRVTNFKPRRKSRITTASAHATESFSLLFQASRELPPFSSIHVIEHGALGKFDLFLVRSDVGERIYYVAVINHIA